MDILIIIDILCLFFGVIGVLLAIYFYGKSKKHKETIAAENRMQLTKIEGVSQELKYN